MVALGTKGFEGLLPQGLPPTAAVVIQGPQGPEKHLLANQFLAEGLAAGEGALVVLTRSSPQEFVQELRALGADVDTHIRDGRLVLVDWYSYKSRRVDAVEEEGHVLRSSVSLVNLEMAIVEGVKKLHGLPAKRAVLDLLSPAIKLFGPNLTYDLAGTLRNRLRSEGFVSLFPLEKGMHDDTVLSSLHGTFDGVVDLRRQPTDGGFKLQVAVLFMGQHTVNTWYADLVTRSGRLEVDLVAVAPGEPPVACPVCGTSVPREARACPNCRTEFAHDLPPPPEELLGTARTGARAPKMPGRRRGFTNGAARPGKVNGLSRRGGHVNGLTNGLGGRAGHVNGLTNGVGGKTNGAGGKTNGLVNGLRRSRTGLTNGLTNGTGMTNGLGGTRSHRELARTHWRMLFIPIVAMTLLFAGLLIPSPSTLTNTGLISIDGDFRDWEGQASRIIPTADDALPPDIDVIEAGTILDRDRLSVYVRVEGQMLRGSTDGSNPVRDIVRAFIDVDRDPTTGYWVGGIGAEYKMQVEGRGGLVDIVRLDRYTDTAEGGNWSSWKTHTAAFAQAAGDRLEVQIDWQQVGVTLRADVLVQTQRDPTALDTGVPVLTTERSLLVARQRWVAGEQLSGPGHELLQVDLAAPLGPASLSALRFAVLGTYADGDAGNFQLTSGLTTYDGTLSGRVLTFTFAGPIDIPPSTTHTVSVTADVMVLAGRTISLALLGPEDVSLAEGIATVVTEQTATQASYMGAPSNLRVVDGMFEDWRVSVPDASLDDEDARGRASLNLTHWQALEQAGDLFAYARTEGRMLEGTPSPEPNPRVLPEYFGPPKLQAPDPGRPRVRGVDVLRVYVDTDDAVGKGDFISGLYADHAVEVVGRGGRVLSASWLDWQGGRWAVNTTADVAAATDWHRLELSVDGTSPFAKAFGVVYDLNDWRSAGDGTYSGYQVRGGEVPDATRGSKTVIPMFSGPASNRFLVTGSQDFTVGDVSGTLISMRFQARVSDTLSTDALRVYTSSLSNTPGIALALHADNAGDPGTQLCTGSATLVIPGWSYATCSPTTSVTAGVTYHLVVSKTSGNNQNWVRVRYTFINNRLHAYDGSDDPSTDVLIDQGPGGYGAQNAQPVYLLTGSSYQGDPYHTYALLTITSAQGYGDKFSLSTPASYSAAEFYIRRAGLATGNLVLKICNVVGTSCGSILLTVNKPAGSILTTPEWVTFTFAPLSLSSGVNYAIWLESDSGTGRYETYASISSSAGSPQGPATFDGTTTYRTDVTISGTTFTDVNKDDIPFTLVPEFQDAAVPAVVALVLLGLARRHRRRTAK